MQNKLMERLIRNAKIDTQSDEKSTSTPSTKGQLDLANLLVDELHNIGMRDVTIDENGYVMATLPANCTKDIPTIGFLAHLNIATDVIGKNIQYQNHKSY